MISRRALLVVVSGVVLAAIVGGLLLLGTPGEERGRRLDEKRLSDLMSLRNTVRYRFDGTGKMPASLDELRSRLHPKSGMLDPATGEPYGYEAIDDSTFRLCATFDLPTPDDPAAVEMRYEPWAHGAGRQCFRFRIGVEEHMTPGSVLTPHLEESADSTR